LRVFDADIEIDDEVPAPAPASSSTSHRNNRTTEEEREKLFEGSSHVGEPRMRTPQEILTKYKFGGVINIMNIAIGHGFAVHGR